MGPLTVDDGEVDCPNELIQLSANGASFKIDRLSQRRQGR
jgi:hypothetical protein